MHARAPPDAEAAAANRVDVFTADGEHFPVLKRLLRPCLALTAAVRAPERSRADVAVDTLTFDRVLIFLEASALGRAPPNFGAHLLEDLRAAGAALQCATLCAFCDGKLGGLAARIAVHRWRDVQAANAAGRRWLVLDGMVLDAVSYTHLTLPTKRIV